MKWIDRQIAQKREMPMKLIKFYKIFFTCTRICYYIWSISVAFPCFLHFSVYPFQRHVLFPFLWHLVCPSVSQALPLIDLSYYWILFLLLLDIVFVFNRYCMCSNWIKYFTKKIPKGHNKFLAERQSPPQELEVGHMVGIDNNSWLRHGLMV